MSTKVTQSSPSSPTSSEITSELNTAEVKQKTVRGAMSYFARTLVLNAIGLVSNLILGALLMVSDYGVYGVVTQIIGVLTFFSDIGLASALIQSKKEPTDKDYQTIFWVQMGLAGLIVLVSIVIIQSGLMSAQLGSAGGEILIALACSFVFAALKTVPSIKLTRALNFSKLVWPQIAEQVVFHGVLIVLVMLGLGVKSYSFAIWARSLAGTLVLFLICPYLPKLQFSKNSFTMHVKFGVKFQLNDLLARVKDQFLYLTVSKVVTLQEFGLISFAKSWSMYPYNLTVQNVLAITFPTFSRLQENAHLLKKALEKSIFFITAAIFPLLTGMCVLFYPVTQVVSRYNKWETATLTFILFTLSIAPAAISTPLTNVLNAIGKINKTLGLMILWTVLTWALTFPLLHFVGFNGVAIAAFVISLTSFLPIIMVKKIVNFSLWDNLWRQLLASVAMAVVGYFLTTFASHNLTQFLTTGIILVVIYGLVLILSGHQKLLVELKSLRSK